MSKLSVRISEDPQRPMGHAIVTLEGLPRTLETFEFALGRHGFAANHLGPGGWQGAECWLQPEEVWYSGDALKFMIHPELAFQLENMPYRLAVRGQGLTETAALTLVWPLELDIEEGLESAERRVIGGTRISSAPKPPPPPAPASPPPLPELHPADLPIPDMPIPEMSGGLEAEKEENLPTRVVVRGPGSSPNRLDEAPTRRVEGRIVSTPIDSEARVFGPPGAPKILSEPIAASHEPPSADVRPSPAPVSTPAPPDAVGTAQQNRWFGWLLAIAAIAAAVGGGWWWFNRQSSTPERVPAVTPARPSGDLRMNVTPKPIPASEPRPAPEPVPAPEPRPAPEPALAAEPHPAPEPKPAPKLTPESVRPIPPAPPAPPGSRRDLEDELKSQFDPTLQDLERSLRR
ncbi:MAG: hypothetical protein QG599_316 [Pseudomonadota bacterium]|nr:hypothetical protein [Pseudomonadota bacterium]